MIYEKNYTREIMNMSIKGHHSFTLILPISVAKEYGLEDSSRVIVERTSDGILIKITNM
jgi:antitoxin component of MazEF toxin-antitoxin module